VRCHTGATLHMGMACDHLIIHLPVIIRLIEGPSMSRSSVQGVVPYHGVEVVAGYSVAGEGFVDGGSKE
jgi:hypothetical protein